MNACGIYGGPSGTGTGQVSPKLKGGRILCESEMAQVVPNDQPESEAPVPVS